MDKDNTIPRFRTAKQCIAIIRAIDPDTAITEFYIRQLVDSGAVMSYGTGNKHLVNLDSLLDFLNRGFDEARDSKNSKEKKDGQP